MLRWKLILAGVLYAASSVYAAGTITTYTSAVSFGVDATADWGSLGATGGSGLILGTAFNNLASTAPGLTVSGSTPISMGRVDQGVNYLGNFSFDDRLLMTTATAPIGQVAKVPGPIHFTFSQAVFGAGLQISTNVLGPFTATLKAFDGNGVLLTTASASGTSTSQTVGDNSAPFLGIRSSLQEIKAVEVDVPNLTGVTVNRMAFALTATAPVILPGGATGKITAYTTSVSFGGDAVANWGSLGATSGSGVIIGSVFNNVVSSVPTTTVSGISPSSLERVDQGVNYLGNFSPGDKLLMTTAVGARGTIGKGPGPIHFTFNAPVYGAGMQISTNILGPFTATFKAFNAAGSMIGTASASGTSTSQTVGDNSAPFLGIRSSAQEIAAVEVDVPNLTGVTVNQMEIALNASLITNNTIFVSQLYRDIWNVPPDPAGVTSWVSQIAAGTATRPQVAESFFIAPQLQTNGMYITKLYLALKRRDPDFAGWFSLFGQMQNGATPATVLNTFLAAPEYTSVYGGLTDLDFVTALYQNILSRAPDPAGLNFWLITLKFGVPRAVVVNGFVTSPEYDNDVRIRATVDMLYSTVLRRAPDPAGLNFWNIVLEFGVPLRSVINGFITSPEYLGRF